MTYMSKVSGLSWGSLMLFLYCLKSSSDLTRTRLINTNTRYAISWHLTADMVTVTRLHSSNITQRGLGDRVVRNVWHDKNAPVHCIIPCNCRWAAKQTARPHRQQVSPGRQVRRGQKQRAQRREETDESFQPRRIRTMWCQPWTIRQWGSLVFPFLCGHDNEPILQLNKT